MKPRVLLVGRLDAAAEERLAAATDVTRCDESEFAGNSGMAGGFDAIVARTQTRITRAVLQAGAGRLRVVGIAGVGLERVEVDAARELGVRIVHTPQAASDAVAELAVGLLLQLLRPIPRLASEYSAGKFSEARAAAHGSELRGRTIGVIGMGAIGSRFARICAAGFGARVMYNDIVPVGPFDFATSPVAKDEIWRACDVISLHVPLTPETRGLLNSQLFERLRGDCLLINTCRGAVVETAALVAAIESGRLAGAGLDVTDPEPLPVGHTLLSHPRCIVTPHIAARTHTGLRNMCAVVDQVIEALRG
ncbi:MAG: NAD(P)-dependent oxidoreductase [Phycisphaerae bacterium]|nr:NAD(P)-dependent oxidoreductase [Phycisphaerae bacterium]